jgi:23S rRNA (uracil1939-C5)-methyltransferase
MHPNTVKDLVRLRPPAIVYVSCNPITQLRDIQLLEKVPFRATHWHPLAEVRVFFGAGGWCVRVCFCGEQAGYQTREIVPVDMFPHTPHIETVALLTHKNKWGK